METILFILILLSAFIVIYLLLQLKRAARFGEIMDHWSFTGDPRFYKYTYTDIWVMINPCLKNWFGLKMPKEEDYK